MENLFERLGQGSVLSQLTLSEVTKLMAEVQKADALLSRKQLVEAAAILEPLVRARPDFLLPWCMLGWLHSSQSQMIQAHHCFTQAYLLNPLNKQILVDLAKVQHRLKFNEAAIITLKRANRIEPGNAETLISLGDLHSDQCDLDAALHCYQEILIRNENNKAALYGVAYVYEDMGNTQAAIQNYEMVIKKNRSSPNDKFFLMAACKLAVYGCDIPDDELLSYLELASTAGRKVRATFSHASMLIRQQHHEDAWSKLVEANNLAKKPDLRSGEVEQQYRRLAMEYCAALTVGDRYLPKGGQETVSPVFIVGASRSGKTILETILAQDARVMRSYEQATIDQDIKATAQFLGMPNVIDPWLVPESANDVLRMSFFDRMARLAGGRSIVTNTRPSNITYVGRIAQISDNAKFVFVKRNRDDHAFRILEFLYGEGNSYSYDIKSIYSYLSWYQEMIDLWLRKIPERCLAIKYDDLVCDVDSVIDKVAEFTGLELSLGGTRLQDDRGCSRPYLSWMKSY